MWVNCSSWVERHNRYDNSSLSTYPQLRRRKNNNSKDYTTSALANMWIFDVLISAPGKRSDAYINKQESRKYVRSSPGKRSDAYINKQESGKYVRSSPGKRSDAYINKQESRKYVRRALGKASCDFNPYRH